MGGKFIYAKYIIRLESTLNRFFKVGEPFKKSLIHWLIDTSKYEIS